jgi:chromosome segregation ATPase
LISSFVQDVITHSQKKSEKLKTVVSGHQELAALDKRISEELMKNGLLERKLQMLEHEKTRETWLLKNDLRNLKKANAELQQQLEEQKKALKAQKNTHQEQLKEQKKAHQGRPLLPSSTCIYRFIVDSEKLFTIELRKILMCKEELLTDVKNLLYRRTDDVERLQKVIGDTEQQFVDCLQQVKTLGEKDEQQQKELEDLRGAAQELVDMVGPLEEGEASQWPFLERLREAPKKVLKFLSEAPVACVSNALVFVKSFLPDAQLEIFAQGMAADCTEEQFDEYLQEAQPVAEQIVQSVL